MDSQCNIDEGDFMSSQIQTVQSPGSSSVGSVVPTNTQEFRIDQDGCTSGVVKKNKYFVKMDCMIRLVALVEAGSSTGYLAEVSRSLDRETRTCFFTSDAIHNKYKFIQQINASYGCGGMLCSFENNQLVEFFHFLKRKVNEPLPIKRAVFWPSLQLAANGVKMWVLGPDIQIDEQGKSIENLDDSEFVWLPKEALQQDSDYSTPQIDVSCHIAKPLNSSVLVKYLEVLKGCLSHNFIAGLLITSGMIMSLHYSTVREFFSGCSILVAMGPAETGKSTAVRLSLALFGLEESSHYVRGTNALFLARSAACVLPFAIDDPKGKGKAKTNQLDIGELVVDVYNGSSSANLKTGSRKPVTAPTIASNFMVEETPRVITRTLLVPFDLPSVGPSDSGTERVYREMEELVKTHIFSRSIGWIVSAGAQLRENIHKIEEFREKFKGIFPPRVAQGWAVCAFFAEMILSEVERLQGIESDISVSEEMENVVAFIQTSRRLYPSDATKHTPVIDHKGIVTSFIDELIEIASGKDIQEVLHYMRSDARVSNRPVLAVALNDVSSKLSLSVSTITAAMRATHYGKSDEVKDFLRQGSADTFIVRDKNSIRRRCCVVYLDMLSEQQKGKIKEITKQCYITAATMSTETQGVQAHKHESDDESTSDSVPAEKRKKI